MTDHQYQNDTWVGHIREHRLEQAAVTIARNDIDRRLTEMNQLREQINQERGHFPTRLEHDQLTTRINALETQMAGWIGRMSIVAALAGLLVSITTTVLLRLLNV